MKVATSSAVHHDEHRRHAKLSPSARFAAFLPLYIVYLSPIIYALASHRASADDHVLPFVAPTLRTTLAWLGLTTAYYFLNNWLLYASGLFLCLFVLCVFLQTSVAFVFKGGTVRIKNVAERKEDLLRMFVMSIPLLSFAR